MTSVSASPIDRIGACPPNFGKGCRSGRAQPEAISRPPFYPGCARRRGSLGFTESPGRERKQQPAQQGPVAPPAGARVEASRERALHAECDFAVVHAGAPPASNSAAPASTMLAQIPIAAASAIWATISAAIIRVLVISCSPLPALNARNRQTGSALDD